MSLCDNCMNYPCTDGVSVMLKLCPAFSPILRPMTNADRIRSMSDEELADYLRYYSDSYARYDMDWFDWLRQEVKEGE